MSNICLCLIYLSVNFSYTTISKITFLLSFPSWNNRYTIALCIYEKFEDAEMHVTCKNIISK